MILLTDMDYLEFGVAEFGIASFGSFSLSGAPIITSGKNPLFLMTKMRSVQATTKSTAVVLTSSKAPEERVI